MIITEDSRGVYAVFDYRPHIVKELKEIPGTRFQGKEKGWMIPYTAQRKNADNTVTTFHNKEQIEKFKKKYVKRVEGSDAPEQIYKIEELPDLTIPLPWRDGVTPYPFQNNCIARGLELKRFINAAQPGLGKSLMAIGTVLGFEYFSQVERQRNNLEAAKALNPFPCLVICPSTLKPNWQREVEKFTHKRALILDAKNKSTWHSLSRMGMADFIIVNYESLFTQFVTGTTNKKGTDPTLKDMLFDPRINLFKSVIIDELHRLKQNSTRQSRVAKGITTGKQMIVGLTGTPVVNRPKDLISQLSIINQLHNFGGNKYFLDRYCAGGTGASNLAELNGKLNNICFFRKEKKDVLTQLPEKMYEKFLCDITTREEYDLAKNDLGSFLKQSGYSDKQVNKSLNAEIMVKMGVLKAVSARGKLNDAIEHIQEIVDAGEKIVVFIHQKFMADALLKQFPGSVAVRGQEVDPDTGKERPQSSAARQAAVDKFQSCKMCGVNQENHDKVKDHEFIPNDVNVIVCSIKAAGVGITLTAASRLIFLELPWHPADVEQCSDRIHRITQRNACEIGFFLGKDTIDEKIYKMIEEKRGVSDAITGTTTSIDTIITDLTRSLFNQK
jgi:SWI/SNF-related matrix-associated actin-dependent regulator of chromatin subfamily A-like protein 1